ncbi:hypothetical protein OVA29_10025 [Exiguobacterium sp. SL14]|nr:hypothetical protein [Exiguobacterium sp. SL14]MCY1690961.1 hypothetical protein [Exiguobacterium sp. SL14]
MKTKAERVSYIQEEKRQLAKPRFYSSLFYGISIFLVVTFQEAYWPFLLLVAALIWIARIHMIEAERDIELTEKRRMKKNIQLQYTTNFVFIILIGLFYPVLFMFDLPLFPNIFVYALFVVVFLTLDTSLERSGRRLDAEHPTKKELRTYPKSWKKI